MSDRVSPKRARAILAQEIRNARGGHYIFTVQASAGGDSQEMFDRFLANFTCRLVLFRHANVNKDANQATILATVDFRPPFGDTAATFEVNRFLGSTTPGGNFPIGNGLGVAVVVEKTTPGSLAFSGCRFSRASMR